MANKFEATYTDGTSFSAPCDGDSSLTTATTKTTAPSQSYSKMKTAVVGDCVTSIGQSAFSDCTSLTSVTIPSGVTSIGSLAFDRCYSLTSVTIPNSVTSIDDYAFRYCYKLTSVTIPSSVTSISEGAFESCSGLTSVTIPSGVTSIDNYTFESCSSLISVTIPSGVTSIGRYAFAFCYSLTSVTINATTPPVIRDWAFYRTNGCPIYVPCGSVDAYKAASSWSSYASRIVGIPPCDEPTPSIEYRWVDSGTTCQGYDKYNLQVKQQSTDGGVTWTDVIPTETQLGALIEAYSTDCGYIPPMNKTCKYYKYQKYVSYDNGATWQPLDEYQRGGLMEYNSPDCGEGIGALYRWEVITSDYQCVGYDKYEKTQKYVSYDNGVTYAAVEPAEYGIGGLIQSNSEDCGYVPPVSTNKFEATYTDGTSFSAPCDGDPSLTTATTKNASAPSHWVMKTAVVGNCVTTIGYEAFYGCLSLTSVTIPSSVTSIGGRAFEECRGLTSVTIPSGVTSIGEYAFYYCTSLTSVTIGNSVTSIGNSTFEGCSSLTSVTIPNSVTSIGNEAFYSCSSLTSVTIPNSVTSISNSVFSNCRNLVSVTIPSSVTSIGAAAFYNCTSLTSVTVESATPPTLGSNAFSNTNDCPIYVPCGSVDAYKAASGWSSYADRIVGIPPCDEPTPSIEYRWVDSGTTCQGYDKYNLQVKQQSADGGVTWTDVIPTETQLGTLIEADSEDCGYVPPVSTTKFSATYTDGTSFSAPCDGDSSLTSGTTKTAPSQGYWIMNTAVIGDCVTRIGAVAFSDCRSLTSVTIPSSVTSISYDAFYKCSGLTSVTIPSSVTSIGEAVFYYCTSLTSVTIPNSVTSIGNSAFYKCSGLTSVYIGSGVTSINASVFEGCSSLTSVTIPNSVTSIGNDAFASCTSLTSVTIPNSVTSIGNSAFLDCTGLTSITIPNNVTSIGNDAFADCSGLTSVTIGNSVTTIGGSAFYKCSGLTSVYIGSGVRRIGNYAFQYCNSLTSITVEATTPPTLDSSVFSYTNNCPIYVPCGSVDTYKAASGWSSYADRIVGIPPCDEPTPDPIYRTTSSSTYCTGYDKYVDVYSQVSYDNGSTWQTTATTPTLVEPNSTDCGYVPPVSTNKFEATYTDGTSFSAPCDGDSSLTSDTTKNASATDYNLMKTAVIGNCVTSIGSYAFASCTSLTSVTIPNSVRSINNSAFYRCSGLTSVTIPDSVKDIERQAFQYCSGMTSVTIGNNVDFIGQSAFNYCTSLTSITVESTAPPSGGNVAFDHTNNCPIYVPSASVDAYKAAYPAYASRIQAIP